MESFDVAVVGGPVRGSAAGHFLWKYHFCSCVTGNEPVC